MTVLEPAGSRSASGLRILLVEDDEGDAVLVRACLNEAGLPDGAITWVRSLADATGALAARPLCILLDLGLPDADGYTGVLKMVDAAPDTAVIVLTGRQRSDGVDALAAGAQDYLVKDVITADLLERSIRYAVERKRAERAQRQLREVRISARERARLERGLLPTPLLRTAGVTCFTHYAPGRDDAVLGGDFFDVVETADGRIRAVIGDVMGHGPDEAALGVHLRVAWRTLVLAGLPDNQILPTLARLLEAEQDEPRRFVTAIDLTIEAGIATIRIAGHPAPIITAGEVARYPDLAVGPPLGLQLPPELGRPWADNHVPVAPGTAVLLYSDGLLDAYSTDDASNTLGISELVAAATQCLRAGGPAAAWIPTLVAAAPRDSIDDTAVVVLRVEGP